MDLFTIQVGRYRLAQKHKVEFIDTTVKSGLKIFAPTWDMVLGHKDGSWSDDRYTEEYLRMMRNSWNTHRDEWMAILQRQEPIAIACYCKPGVFCHRRLLKDIFEKLCEKQGIPFRYYGELEP
jgi:hypothetical protein